MPDADLNLPPLFQKDLIDVVALIVQTNGRHQADNFSTLIDDATQLLGNKSAQWPPSGRASVQFALANALTTFGAQAGDSARLKEAIADYQDALTVWTPKSEPLDWASTKNNLGVAFYDLSKVESEVEQKTQYLNDAKNAFEDASRGKLETLDLVRQDDLASVLADLAESESGAQRLRDLREEIETFRALLQYHTRTPEPAPMFWGVAETSLGIALDDLGRGESEKEPLTEAVEAFGDALKDEKPNTPYWVGTQNELGRALVDLGEGETTEQHLKKAVEAYKAVLGVSNLAPADLAYTQENFGFALTKLGERELGTDDLGKAVAYENDALTELMHEASPQDLAATQDDLWVALADLDERGSGESGTQRLLKDAVGYGDALNERTFNDDPGDWATTQNNLGIALTELGKREPGTYLTRAVRAERDALRERLQENVPLDLAATEADLGNALRALGNSESGTAGKKDLTEAIGHYCTALQEGTQERVPLDWAVTQSHLGGALADLGKRELGTQHLMESVEAYKHALSVLRTADAPYYKQQAEQDLASVQAELAARQAVVIPPKQNQRRDRPSH